LVEQFNQYETDLKLDAALHELFSPPPGGSRLALCAFALDALWNAGISGPHYRDWPDVYNGFLHRIAHLHWLAQEIRGRPLPVSDAVLDQEVIPRSSLLLKNVLDLAPTAFYVFATKFMHWWVGTPPIDAKSAKAIRLLCNHLETNRDGGTRAERLDEFERLLKVYNCWLNQLGPDGIRDLQRHDYDTQGQFPDLRSWNSPVRILDKYLWLIGR
jgi:hypothetical protein